MYTGVENKDTISSFLHGYEAGRDGECNFIERLSDSIAEEYQIESMAAGWIGQIQMTAEELSSTKFKGSEQRATWSKPQRISRIFQEKNLRQSIWTDLSF